MLQIVDGTVWGWGFNNRGQLGLGESPSQLAPTQWAPVQVVNLTNVIAIGSGAYHSMALRSDGTLWVWGDNTYGELGSTAPSNPAIATVPQVVQFPSGTVIVAIAAGQGSSFALDNTGTVWAWGTQIGNAVTTYNASPTKVVFPSPTVVTAMAAGTQHLLAIDSSGQLWAWGANFYGQLGNGSTNPTIAPTTPISGLASVTNVAANQSNSMAVDQTGAVYTWGHNNDGQLGIGNQTDKSTPQKLTTISGPVAVAFGFDHALALFADGTMAGWGNSFNGQVGTGFQSLYLSPTSVSGAGFDQPASCPKGPAVGTPATQGPQALELLGANPIDELPTTCVVGTYPINAVTGNYSMTAADLTIPGRGVPLLFTRTYNSLIASQPGPFGIGWVDSYDVYLTFDPNNNATLHEENGAQIQFTFNGTSYQAPSRILASLVKNSDGTYTLNRRDQTHLNFSSAGQLQSETDRNAYSTTVTYNGQQLTSVREPGGRTLNLTYGSNGLVSAVSDSGSRSVTYTYDANNRLSAVTDARHFLTQYGYDSASRLHTITDPNNGVVTIDYDSVSGNAYRLTDPMTHVTTVAYGTNSASTTWPNTAVTTEVFQNNQIVSVTDATGTSISSTWSCSYDPATLGMTVIADPLNRVITNTWDSAGNLLTHADALQHKAVYTFDSLNDIKTITDPLNTTTTNVYDSNGNLMSSSTPLSGTSQVATISYTYDPAHAGDVVQVTDPTGKIWTYTYDQYGNRASSTDPGGDKTTFVYDILGRLTSTVSPRGNMTGGNPAAFTTTYAYDAFGDRTGATDPLNHQTLATYDGNRNVTTTTDPDNHQTIYTYDSDSRMIQIQLPNQGLIKTGFDVSGNVVSYTDPMNNVTKYSYDLLNRQTSVTDPLGRVSVNAYAGVGLLLATRDYLGRTTSNYRDLADNLLGTAYSDGATTKTTYTYDADGQRLTMKDSIGSSSYQYDSLHRLTQYSDGAGNVIKYGYDLNGHVTSITYPGGSNAVVRTYDGVGRLASVKDWLGNTTTYTYDADSNVVTQVYPNTTKATLSYDNADRLIQIVDVTGSKQTQFFQAVYQRDAAELLTAEGSTSFAYDTLERLATAGATTYGYNSANNLTSIAITGSTTTTITYDAASQPGTLTKMNGSTLVQKLTYTYDNVGNRTAVTDQNNASTNLGYDQAGRLASYGTTATYKYTGDGVRASKTVSGATAQEVWSLTEGLPTILRDGSTNFVTGLRGLPLEQIVTSGRTTSVYYYHQDQIGSTRVITNSKGATTNTYTFDPYGNLTASTGMLANPFRYAGQYFDSESGYYYLRARYYDPASGQFITRDPRVSTTHEPYGLAQDDPLNGADLSGLGSSPDPNNPLTWNWGAGISALITSAKAQDWKSAFTPQNFSDSAHAVGAVCSAILVVAPESAEYTGPCIIETGVIAAVADGWLIIHGDHSPKTVLSFGLDLIDIVTGGAATYVYWKTAGLSVDELEAAYINAQRAHDAYVYIRNASNDVFAMELFGYIAGVADMTAWYLGHNPH